MKKFICLILLLSLAACQTQEEPPIPKSEGEIFEEILAAEKKMRTLSNFKIEKVEDAESIVCQNGVSVKEVENNAPQGIVVQSVEGRYLYHLTQKEPYGSRDQHVYYIDGVRYIINAQVPSVYTTQEGNDEDVVLHRSLKAVDTRFFEVKKSKEDDFSVYEVTLKDEDGYNKAYPDDYRDDSCNLNVKYVAQRMIVKINKDGYIVNQRIEESLHYQGNTEQLERLNTTQYEFHSFNEMAPIDFYFLR